MSSDEHHQAAEKEVAVDVAEAVVEEPQVPTSPEYEPATEHHPVGEEVAVDVAEAVVNESQEVPTAPEYEPRTEPLPGYAADAQPVPVYVEHEASSLQRMVYARRNNSATCPENITDQETWRQYLEIYPPSTKPWTERDARENAIAESSLYASINQGKEDVIAFLIENNIATPNTKLSSTEETPLLRAVTQKNVRVVQQLLDLGAEKDAFGSVSRNYGRGGVDHTFRTPLQHAASTGHLVLVKLLMEQYHCDDSIVAPDGQIALRLAAENGHYEVVDYLPPRRLGGFKRWKHTHKKALRRLEKSLTNIADLLKVLFWDVPKLLLWTIPKHTIVKPIAICWKKRKDFGLWCKRALLKAPERATKLVKRSWKFGTKTLPVLLWKLVTERIPKAIGIVARWVWSRTVASAKAIWNVILKIASFFSTVAEAIISFLRRVTLADVCSSFVEVLRAIFVTFPKTMLSWLHTFFNTSYKVMKTLFGTLGKVIWWIGMALGWMILFIPVQLWKALKSFGQSFVKGFHELKVWLDPKAR